MHVAINGIDLHYEISGEGEPLLWLHGFMGAGLDWKYVFNDVPAGFQLIAPDLRGHGASTNPSREFSFRQSARYLTSGTSSGPTISDGRSPAPEIFSRAAATACLSRLKSIASDEGPMETMATRSSSFTRIVEIVLNTSLTWPVAGKSR